MLHSHLPCSCPSPSSRANRSGVGTSSSSSPQIKIQKEGSRVDFHPPTPNSSTSHSLTLHHPPSKPNPKGILQQQSLPSRKSSSAQLSPKWGPPDAPTNPPRRNSPCGGPNLVPRLQVDSWWRVTLLMLQQNGIVELASKRSSRGREQKPGAAEARELLGHVHVHDHCSYVCPSHAILPVSWWLSEDDITCHRNFSPLN